MADSSFWSPRAAALMRAMRNLGSREKVEERAEAAKAGSEEISKTLPSALMPREAILRKRKQMQQMDEMLKGN